LKAQHIDVTIRSRNEPMKQAELAGNQSCVFTENILRHADAIRAIVPRTPRCTKPRQPGRLRTHMRPFW
jgi:hypothetical protein